VLHVHMELVDEALGEDKRVVALFICPPDDLVAVSRGKRVSLGVPMISAGCSHSLNVSEVSNVLNLIAKDVFEQSIESVEGHIDSRMPDVAEVVDCDPTNVHLHCVWSLWPCGECLF
jgi:hypothetical protein